MKAPPVQPKAAPALAYIWVIAACGVAALLGVVALIFMMGSAPPDPGPAAGNAPPLIKEPDRKSVAPIPTAPGGLDEEALARDLYDGAEAFAKENKDKPDLVLARYRTVATAWPATTWAAKARDRSASLEEELKKLFENEFESLRRKAQGLAKAGDLKGALDAIDAYLAGHPRDILKRRAAVERAVIENDAREAFNALVRRAGDLCKAGKDDEAIAAFETMAKGAMSDVAVSCAEEIAKIREARKEHEAAKKVAEAAGAEDKLRTTVQKALPLARDRKYDEAAAAIPDAAEPLKALVEDERAALRAASEFWKAVEAGAKAHVGSETILKLGDGKREKGKLTKSGPAGVALGDRDFEWGALHDDQLIKFAFAKGQLVETAPESYLKAAMFFYYAGKETLAKLELATAKELGGDIARFEKVWRAGLMRPPR